MSGTALRLAIVSSHPIQYNAPFFQLLSVEPDLEIKVFYTWSQAQAGLKYDPGFGKKIEWDIPLLGGYEYSFVENTAAKPGTHHFRGLVNPGLTDAISKWNAGAVLVFGWSFHSHLECMRHFHGRIPVIFRGDSTLLDDQPGVKKWLRRIFLTWVYRHADYALYTGKNNRDYFLKNGLRQNQLVFAPHAIDNKRFEEPDDKYSDEARAWRQSLDIPDDRLVLLFAGKLEPKKNPFYLLKLAGHPACKNLVIVIAGSGILEKELREKAAGYKNIIFIGFQNQQQMPVLYRLADVFILPSSGPGETWGLSVNEAMASGRPVIVSQKTGCAADLIEENRNGITITENNIDECTLFLNQLEKDRTRLSAMGKASQRIIQDYSFQHIVKGILAVGEKISAAGTSKKFL